MRQSTVFLAGSLVALVVASNTSFAQGSVDFGKNEYMASCASCDGVSAKGDGAVRMYLTKAPTDLTIMAKRNGGVFPAQYAWEVIDGRTSVVSGADSGEIACALT